MSVLSEIKLVLSKKIILKKTLKDIYYEMLLTCWLVILNVDEKNLSKHLFIWMVGVMYDR